jgi:hypothetical protein
MHDNIWKMAFDQTETVFYYGIATLFGEEEQELYPCTETYKQWMTDTYNCFINVVGLDKYCALSIIEDLDKEFVFSFFLIQ